MALLALPAPYDFQLSTARFRSYGPDRANLWHDDALWRVIDGQAVRIAAAAAGGAGVDVEPWSPAIEHEVRVLLGGPFDLSGFPAFVAASGDPVLAGLHARFAGFRPPLAPGPLEALVTGITAQQVSLRSAFAVRNRLIAAYGEPPVAAEPQPAPAAAAPAGLCAFPRAERLAAVAPADLLPLGFSRRKAEYVVGVAQAASALDGLAALADEDVKARLVALRGLGEWTADWFLARHLARPRAWPAGDLVLRKACSRHYAAGRELSAAEVRALGERFAPFENHVAHLLLIGSTLP
jgi:3-methyladenine DNA glycosylase/8-oxoguanine DNA glycosylase